MQTTFSRFAKTFKHLLGAALLTISFAALASPLDDARDAGYVVELPTGYVAKANAAPASIAALVADINQRRKEAYERIARKNGITTEQVGAESYRHRSMPSQ
jgi:uncharacterized protein YdbL (DUF1318 family)